MTPRPEEARYDAWWRVDEVAAIAAVRRAATAAATALGFDEGRVAEVGIATSELATNLVRHAGGGEVVLRSSPPTAPTPELRVLAVDSGPGRRNIAAMFADGVSSIGTLGIGLGACARIANHFDAYSLPGVGTVVELVLRGAVTEQTGPQRVASLTRPLSGEGPCGDTAAAHVDPNGRVVTMLADGLGHGPLAAEASRRAAEVFEDSVAAAPAVILDRIHQALTSTRGAAVSVVTHDPEKGQLTHAGVGNVAVRLVGDAASQTLPAQPGIVGHRMPRVRELTTRVGSLRVGVLHSDGITHRWDLDELPGVLDHSLGTLCASLTRMAASGRDDAGVIAIRLTP